MSDKIKGQIAIPPGPSDPVPARTRDDFKQSLSDTVDTEGLPFVALAEILKRAYYGNNCHYIVTRFNELFDDVQIDGYLNGSTRTFNYRIEWDEPIEESGLGFVKQIEREEKKQEAKRLAEKLRELIEDLYHPSETGTIDYQLRHWIGKLDE